MLFRSAMSTCGGDSKDPEAVRAAIFAEAERIGREGISEEEFRSLKRSALGRRIRSLDSFDGLCFRLCESYFDGADYLNFPAAYESVCREDVEVFIREKLLPQRGTMAIVWPRGEERGKA